MVSTIPHHKNLSTIDFSAHKHYVLLVMNQFRKNRIKLLEELHELVSKALTESHDYLTRDIKRYNRKLKVVRKEVGTWISEMVQNEKLAAAERRHNEEKRKENEANAAQRAMEHQ